MLAHGRCPQVMLPWAPKWAPRSLAVDGRGTATRRGVGWVRQPSAHVGRVLGSSHVRDPTEPPSSTDPIPSPAAELRTEPGQATYPGDASGATIRFRLRRRLEPLQPWPPPRSGGPLSDAAPARFSAEGRRSGGLTATWPGKLRPCAVSLAIPPRRASVLGSRHASQFYQTKRGDEGRRPSAEQMD